MLLIVEPGPVPDFLLCLESCFKLPQVDSPVLQGLLRLRKRCGTLAIGGLIFSGSFGICYLQYFQRQEAASTSNYF